MWSSERSQSNSVGTTACVELQETRGGCFHRSEPMQQVPANRDCFTISIYFSTSRREGRTGAEKRKNWFLNWSRKEEEEDDDDMKVPTFQHAVCGGTDTTEAGWRSHSRKKGGKRIHPTWPSTSPRMGHPQLLMGSMGHHTWCPQASWSTAGCGLSPYWAWGCMALPCLVTVDAEGPSWFQALHVDIANWWIKEKTGRKQLCPGTQSSPHILLPFGLTAKSTSVHRCGFQQWFMEHTTISMSNQSCIAWTSQRNAGAKVPLQVSRPSSCPKPGCYQI